MAIEDALRVIAAEWADIEPRLAASELVALAGIGRRATPGGDAERSLAVFEIIADTLPPGHEAWSALRSSGTRFDPGRRPGEAGLVTAQLVGFAADALASPTAPLDAAADDLEERSVAAIVACGGLYGDDDRISRGEGAGALARDGLLLSIRVDGRPFFPLFQFTSDGTYQQYELVARLREQLGADSDPSGAAAWWLTPNPWLQARPADLLGTPREAQIRYAADQLANDGW
jgi:hypothetical protein